MELQYELPYLIISLTSSISGSPVQFLSRPFITNSQMKQVFQFLLICRFFSLFVCSLVYLFLYFIFGFVVFCFVYLFIYFVCVYVFFNKEFKITTDCVYNDI